MKERTLRGASFASLLLCTTAACQVPLVFQDPSAAQPLPAWQTQGRFRGPQPTAEEVYDEGYQRAAAGEPAQSPAGDPLYGWDGGVVESPEPGGLESRSDPSTRGLEPSLAGRMHILELYQQVLDERDALQDEVDALRGALATSEQRFGAERTTFASERTRLEALEAESHALAEENRDLLARLTTAQIRRLEAEKLLLETQIAWHDERSGIARAASPIALPKKP